MFNGNIQCKVNSSVLYQTQEDIENEFNVGDVERIIRYLIFLIGRRIFGGNITLKELLLWGEWSYQLLESMHLWMVINQTTKL